MEVKFIVEEDFCNYKEPSMFIGFPYCTFKCDKENNCQICQNMPLINNPNINISIESIYKRYTSNDISKAIVCGGLEPFESYTDLLELIKYFRKHGCNDKFVIYTGFTEEEVRERFSGIFNENNLIIKFGRFRPNQAPHYDDVLGIGLASENQYAKYYC